MTKLRQEIKSRELNNTTKHTKPENKLSAADDTVKGHRKRLREKLLSTKGEGLLDYELLECLLFSSIPRRDVKPLAKKLLKEHGSLWRLFSAQPDRLADAGLSEAAIGNLLLIKIATARALKGEIINTNVFTSWQSIIDYLKIEIGYETLENLRVLFMDTKGRVLKSEIKDVGTLNNTAILVRNIVKKGVELNAASIVLAHNHPSGNVQPSKEDKEITDYLKQSCLAVGIVIIDHIIISHDSFFSFKHNNLL